jgi:hypothetical protein
MKKLNKKDDQMFIRINSNLKQEFKLWCDDNYTGMSDKLTQLLVEFLKSNKNGK